MSSEKLRVLQIVPSFGVGGAEQMAGHLMVGLSESAEVSGATMFPATDGPIEKKLQHAGIPLWHLGKRKGFDPRMFLAFDRLLRQVRPHVVHTHLSVLRYCLPALIRRRIPAVVHTLHNVAEHEADAIGRIVQWFAFRGWVRPIAISTEVAASFRRLYHLDCKGIVPNCIPVHQYQGLSDRRVAWREREGLGADAVVFISVGRLEPQKNHKLLLEAFAVLTTRRRGLSYAGAAASRRNSSPTPRQMVLGNGFYFWGSAITFRNAWRPATCSCCPRIGKEIHWP